MAIFGSWVPTFAQGRSSCEAILLSHKGEIIAAAQAFHIAPRMLASVIYAERHLNRRPGEDVIDKILARAGYNSSVGLAQVKVETAAWILQELRRRESPCYLGAQAAAQIPISCTRGELITQLEDASTNLYYAAAYLAMISKLWGEILLNPSYTEEAVGLISTLYSLGIVRNDGTLRLPHDRPQMNSFGRAALDFYRSFALVEEFGENLWPEANKNN